MGKPCFRIDTSTDFCEIDDQGRPVWIRADGSRELVEDPEQAQRLIEEAKRLRLVDPLEGTSIWAMQHNELTVGSLYGLEIDEEPVNLKELASSLSGASPETFREWTEEQLTTFVRELWKRVEPPLGTSAHPVVWGKKLTVGSLMPKEEGP